MSIGMFWGVGVGPGRTGLIPLAAVQALQKADVILAPRAKGASYSVARECLTGLDLPPECIREIVYGMESDRTATLAYYEELSRKIARDLTAGKNVAYLTIGDSLTYSTYGYLLEALLRLLPDLEHETFPGITSYAAVAALLDWPLGQGKERVLILPCPDDEESLKHELLSHEIVVLMKIGARLPMVLQVLRELSLDAQCAYGSRVGLPGEVVSTDITDLDGAETNGYLMTMLIKSRTAYAAASTAAAASTGGAAPTGAAARTGGIILKTRSGDAPTGGLRSKAVRSYMFTGLRHFLSVGAAFMPPAEIGFALGRIYNRFRPYIHEPGPLASMNAHPWHRSHVSED